jgi:hypothetical protein
MSTSSLRLTKFDAAERQLNQAIRLFFSGGDEVSVHTLAEASAQVLYDTRTQHGGGSSLIRDSDWIRPEHRKEWLSYAHRSRNFFKHADRDGSDVHEFKDVFNHFSLLDSVNLYLSAKKSWTPETLLFFGWFVLTYPDLLHKDDHAMTSFLDQQISGDNPVDPANFRAIAECIDELRSGRRSLPNVTLELGLSASIL